MQCDVSYYGPQNQQEFARMRINSYMCIYIYKYILYEVIEIHFTSNLRNENEFYNMKIH
jgi:hypothetical protein